MEDKRMYDMLKTESLPRMFLANHQCEIYFISNTACQTISIMTYCLSYKIFSDLSDLILTLANPVIYILLDKP